MLRIQTPLTNFVEQPVGVDLSDGASNYGLEGHVYGGRKWPIHYDSVEPLAIAADIATIVLSSVLAGLSYHLHAPETPLDVSKSLGSAILVSALFISLMKIRGTYRPTELLVLRNQIRAVCLTWMGVFFLLAASVFALKIGSEISRATSMLFATFGFIALIAHRRVMSSLLAKGLTERRFSGRNVVLITDQAKKGEASLIQTLTGLGLRVKRNFLLPPPGADSRGRAGQSDAAAQPRPAQPRGPRRVGWHLAAGVLGAQPAGAGSRGGNHRLAVPGASQCDSSVAGADGSN